MQRNGKLRGIIEPVIILQRTSFIDLFTSKYFLFKNNSRITFLS